MLNLWAPAYGNIHIIHADNVTNHTQLPLAEHWAATQWYPRISGLFVVAMLIPFLACYEFLLHIPTEVAIWFRICQGRRTKRGVMPLAILWLRYWTLMLGILSAISVWGRHQSLNRCSTVIWPLTFAIGTLVSVSTACVNAWRSRTITRAAIQTTSYYYLLQTICSIFVIVRLAALVTAFVFQHFAFTYLTLLKRSDRPVLNSTCFSFNLALAQKIKVVPDLMNEYNYQAPVYTSFALLIALVVSDLALAFATLSSILKLKRNIASESSLISSLFNYSIMYYTILIVLDLAGLAYYIATSDNNVIILLIAIGSILTVRALINEQECIMSATHPRSYWTRFMANKPQMFAGGADRSAWTQEAGNGFDRKMIPQGLRAKIAATNEEKVANVLMNDNRQLSEIRNMGIQRRGAGMTDIERVTVLEAGRSIDRPWPEWDDDDDAEIENDDAANVTSADRVRSAFWQRERIEGEKNGIQTLIREWWRDVEDADPMSQISHNIRTHDGALDIRGGGGRGDLDTQSSAIRINEEGQTLRKKSIRGRNTFSRRTQTSSEIYPSGIANQPFDKHKFALTPAKEQSAESKEDEDVVDDKGRRMSAASQSVTSLQPSNSKSNQIRQHRRAASLDS